MEKINNKNIPNERSLFTPNVSKFQKENLQVRNDPAKSRELTDRTKQDAKVNIDNVIKDFAKIKMAVDRSEPIDNSEKVKRLKEEIKNGNYVINYDELSDKILEGEF